ncbi:sensor histidine kinase [Alicyclobacillus cycloheptanicus]|uniref:histidine kinase n=1 Tax=Alicyclobacillus cycloheptanicus TaxID=1457 RepID=A0ABT9XGQ6_9BACL|nr:sensor histidine kinase [Alicyclobacillus cycloheptanicus]MDQ0189494.1 two-component sensor histidine kinase/PAS domain-containing protein [Alicyclobacillus cycloheptanicus]WDM01558.1 sensor histidine kinase [Alicyclobacillus cycloheptanicus]
MTGFIATSPELIAAVCQSKTDLTADEIEEVIRLAGQLQTMADLNRADVFIDCLWRGRSDQAVVVAQSKPNTGGSLYSEFIVGQRILRDNEPGVFYAFQTDKYVTGTRAITNENVTIQQKILPFHGSSGRVIGVVILEQDISSQVIQEQAARLFQQTAEDLGETLWEVAVAEINLPSLIHEGVILCNSEYLFTYINPTARQWFEKLHQPKPEIGAPLDAVFSGVLQQVLLDAHDRGVEAREFTFGDNTVLVKAISIQKHSVFKGGLILLSDITELREKERQLTIQSTVMKEIHHRVKNNLQTISSLLRLQMRRTKSEEIRAAFQDSIHRIKTIALVHERLSQSGIEFVELRQLMEAIASMLIQTARHPEKSVQYTVEADAISLPSEKATPIALILNELIQNCLDHAFEYQSGGRIYVSAGCDGGELVIVVQDNGQGWDLRTSDDTLGTRIVETLVTEDLNGQIDYVVDGGTRVTVRFPFARVSAN